MNREINNDIAVIELPDTNWDFSLTEENPSFKNYTNKIEEGFVLFFPQLKLELTEEEKILLSPEIVDPKRKNISFNGLTKEIKGLRDSEKKEIVLGLLARYYDYTNRLINTFFPDYQGKMKNPINTLRVRDIKEWQGKVSFRKDDARLHVDAFPSRPLHGLRNLRIFTNINPEGRPRSWRIGEPFENLAKRMLPTIKPYLPFSA